MLNLHETSVAPRKVDLFHRLMSGAEMPIYVLGLNKYAQRVSRAFKMEAFIDDFTKLP
jgi:hypothetical protein